MPLAWKIMQFLTDKSVPLQSMMSITPPSRAGWTSKQIKAKQELGLLKQMMPINGSKLISVVRKSQLHVSRLKGEMVTALGSGWPSTSCSTVTTLEATSITGNKGKTPTRWSTNISPKSGFISLHRRNILKIRHLKCVAWIFCYFRRYCLYLARKFARCFWHATTAQKKLRFVKDINVQGKSIRLYFYKLCEGYCIS